MFTGAQALEYLGSKLKPPNAMYGGERRRKSKVDEARDILANIVLCHVPVRGMYVCTYVTGHREPFVWLVACTRCKAWSMLADIILRHVPVCCGLITANR